jgi:hypothetical protein
MPHKKRNPINKLSDSVMNIKGEIRQQQQDKRSIINAIRLVPNICARYPARTQANPPIPIIRNDNNGILNVASGCPMLYVFNMIGTNAQKAYNSHI